MKYISYNKYTGQIIAKGQCYSYSELIGEDFESFIIVSEYTDYSTKYVDVKTKTIVDKEEYIIGVYEDVIKADGEDYSTINLLPNTTVKYNKITYDLTGEDVFEFSTIQKGIHTLTFSSIYHSPTTIEIEAI